MTRFRLIIFDLDNTIYDWYSAFLPAFYRMTDIAARSLACDPEELLNQLQRVHVRHADVEHPFSILETDIVLQRITELGRDNLLQILDPAFHAFNSARKENLRLFPETQETLRELHRRGMRLAAYTDSKYYAAVSRVQRLNIGDFFERIYCREKSATQLPASYRTYSGVASEKVVELPSHRSKPNPRVLAEIVSGLGELMQNAAYIGDSIAKDVMMAKHAGCFAVWAKYGAHADAAMYEKLIRISHWTKTDIARERQYWTEAQRIKPDFICEKSIADILSLMSAEEKGQRVSEAM